VGKDAAVHGTRGSAGHGAPWATSWNNQATSLSPWPHPDAASKRSNYRRALWALGDARSERRDVLHADAATIPFADDDGIDGSAGANDGET